MMRLDRILPLLCGLMCPVVQCMEETKREREEEKEIQRQSEQNKPSKLSDNRQREVDQELINAAQDADLIGIQDALSRGAHVNFRYLDKDKKEMSSLLALLISRSEPYPVIRQGVHFLLEHGAVITEQEMVGATHTTAYIIEQFICYGGNIARAAGKMLSESIDIFSDALDPEDPDYNQECAIEESHILLGLLLQFPLSEEQAKKLKEVLDIPFTLHNGQRVSLRDKLGPLLKALIFDHPEEVKQIFEKLNKTRTFGRLNVSEQDEAGLNSALIFAAQGNRELLSRILENYKKLLNTNAAETAFSAAAMRGHAHALQALITNNLLSGYDLIQRLQECLILAASQQHQNIVQLITETDRKLNLNLDMVPVGRQLDFFIKNEDLPGDVRNNYAYIRDILADYIHQRYALLMYMRRKLEAESAEQEKEKESSDKEQEAEAKQVELSASLGTLPAWILALLITFLRLPEHKWKP